MHRPIFIFGCQRSGTTALAVMLDRHSQIATLPETQFFTELVPRLRGLGGRRALLEAAFSHQGVIDTKLGRDEVARSFEGEEPGAAGLLRALLRAYGRAHGKTRVAEKSCGHLFFVRDLLKAFPEAQMICIVRDGRDVVSSLARVSWGRFLPLPAHCLQWLSFARRAARERRRLPAGVFLSVRYEDLMTHPEIELRRICAFLGEDFEPAQLRPGASSAVVPGAEVAWKGKAKEEPDPGRVSAWRREMAPETLARLNYHLGSELRRWGYPDTEARGAPVHRLAWSLSFLPYRRPVAPVVRTAYRLARRFRPLPAEEG